MEHDLEKSDSEFPDPELYAQMMECPENQLGLLSSQDFRLSRGICHPN